MGDQCRWLPRGAVRGLGRAVALVRRLSGLLVKPIWFAQWKLEVLPLGQLTSQTVCEDAQNKFLRAHLGPVLTSSTAPASPLHRLTSFHFMRYCRPDDLENWTHRTGAVFVVRLFASRRYMDKIVKHFAGLVAGWRATGAITDDVYDGVKDWVKGVTDYQGGRSLASEFRDLLHNASMCCLDRLSGGTSPLPDTAGRPPNWGHCVNLIVVGH